MKICLRKYGYMEIRDYVNLSHFFRGGIEEFPNKK
jgi:hypothetical protein